MNSKYIVSVFRKMLFFLLFLAALINPFAHAAKKQGNFFLENKGQVKDEFGNLRTDIDFYFHSGSNTVYIGKNGVHYQHTKILETKKSEPEQGFENAGKGSLTHSRINFKRVDLELLNSNLGCEIVTEDALPYYEVFHNADPKNRGIKANAYQQITFKNLYPGIDWQWLFNSNGELKHQFIIHHNGNIENIKLLYKGCDSIVVSQSGVLNINSSLGLITESAPICFDESGRPVEVRYKVNGNQLSYSSSFKNSLTIDPLIGWGTYYGADSSYSDFKHIARDSSYNIYFCGQTYSSLAGSIATSGRFDTVLQYSNDGYFGKFDSAGLLKWCSYYGGDSDDYVTSIYCDYAGNLYITGTTTSSTGISTPGSQQEMYNGGWCGFAAQMDSGGFRNWGTYLGSGSTVLPQSVFADSFGNCIISGCTNDQRQIASTRGYQNCIRGTNTGASRGNIDWFIVKYNIFGERAWGTYFGGLSNELGGTAVLSNNYIYLAGYSFSDTGIATPGCYQHTFSGGLSDAFVAKFDVDTGYLVWGTYYGGSEQEMTGGIDAKGNNVCLLGKTQSDDSIASPHALQPTRAGGMDAFVAVLDTLGNRKWGSYFGGVDDEDVTYSCPWVDDSNRILIVGITNSTAGIAISSDSFQTTYGGGNGDAFIAQFNDTGALQFATYIGGDQLDQGFSLLTAPKAIFIAGATSSTNKIATPGACLDHGGGNPNYTQSFLIRINMIDTSTTVIQVGSLHMTEFQLMPNPSKDEVSIVLPETFSSRESTRLKIVDVNSVVKIDREFQSQDKTLNIQLGKELCTGVYFVQIEQKGKILTKQLVIQK